jgi:diguanylate cyclase (GGDEF)-like protein/PAS domain S-box-containing protein
MATDDSSSLACFTLRIAPDLVFESVSESLCQKMGRPAQWFMDNPRQAAADLRLHKLVADLPTPGTELTATWRLEQVDTERAIFVRGTCAPHSPSSQSERMTGPLLHDALEMAPVGLLVVDPTTGRMRYANEAMCVFFRRDLDDLLSRTWRDLTYPEDVDTSLRGMELLRDGFVDIFRTRKRYVRPDGSTVWGDLSAVSIRDEAGQPVVYVAQVIDASEAVSARRELEASERQYRLLAEHASDLVFQITPGWKLAWISPSVEAILGWTPDELINEDVPISLIHPDAGEFPDDVDVVDGLLSHEVHLRCKDGTMRWMSVSARAMRDDAGGVIGIAGSARDVTDKVRVLKEAQELSERLQATLNSMLDPLVVLQAIRDDDGRIIDFLHIDANHAAGRHTHRTREELVGVRMSDIVPGQDDAGLFGLYANVIETGQPLVIDAVPYEDEMQSGKLRLFDMRGVKVGDAVCMTFRDVTERELAARTLAESENRFRLLAENASDIVLEHREHIVWVSEALTATLGFATADWVGKSLLEYVHPEDRARLDWHSEAFAADEAVRTDTVRYATADGTYRWLASRAHPIFDNGVLVGAVVGLRDVDEEVRASLALARSQALLSAAIGSAPMGVALTDLDGRITIPNAALSAIVQRDEASLIGTQILDLLHPEEVEALKQVWQELAAGSQEDFEGLLRLGRADGTWAWAKAGAVRLPDAPGEEGHILLQLDDVTAEREAQAALAYQVFHDQLTGLRNRAWIMDILAEDLQMASGNGHRVGVLFIDLDHFKVINDSLGHAAGDEVIGVVATRIASVLGPNDRLGRFGGDEFVVIVPELRTPTDAERVAERIDAVVRDELVIQGHRIVPSVSTGITVSQPDSSPEDLLRDTDAALFRAKAAGRGRWHFFDAHLHAQALDRLTIEARIRRALSAREFVVHYQPIVRLRDRRIQGYEALVRWQDPEHGLVPPGDFLPVAEESGLIVDIGQHVLEQVCETLTRRPGPISVNVSAVQLSSKAWVQRFLDTMTTFGVTPHQLIVEVTETAVLSQLEDCRADLTVLRDLGIGIHVDDFGTGFSSISLLRDLPVTGLKMDRSFVNDLTVADSQANALAAGLAGLAAGLHVLGIAEGIETDEQCQTLLAQGWEHGQGYLFGRPAPLEP